MGSRCFHPPGKQAFTLAEVLIALALLGVVAAFAIPKVMQTAQSQHFNAVAKETISTISQAYQLYREASNGEVPTTTMGDNLMPYINHLGIDRTGGIDTVPGWPIATYECSEPTLVCLRLPNNAILMFHDRIQVNEASFGGKTNLHAINFILDPDGVVTNRQDSLAIWLYYNGKIVTSKEIMPGTVRADGLVVPPYNVPDWFRWN